MRIRRVISSLAAGALLTAAAVPMMRPDAQASPPETPAPTGAGTLHYRLEADSSTVHVHTGSSGLFGFMGHEHVVSVPRFTGEVEIDPNDVTRFSFAIVAPADSLKLAGEKEDPDTRRKIETDMKAEVLETAKYPTIELRGVDFKLKGGGQRSTSTAGVHEGQLSLALTLHGTKRVIEVPLRLELDRERLRAQGKFSIRHSDFGMKRKKVAGVVNVAERLEIVVDVVGRVITSPQP